MRGGGPGSGQTSSQTSVSQNTRISLYARWRAWLGADFVPDISVTTHTDLVVCEVEGLARGRLRPGHQCHKTHGSRCMRGGGPGSRQTSSRTSVALNTRISLYARWRAWLGADFVPDISVTKRTDLVVCEVEGLARGRLRPWHQCHKTHGSRCMRGGGPGSGQTSSRTSVSQNARISLYARWRAWLGADFVPDISVTKRTDLVCEVEGLARGRLRPGHQCHKTLGSRCMRGGEPGSGQTSSLTSVSLHTRISLYARWRAWLGADFVPDISLTTHTDLVVCEVERLARGRLRPGHQSHYTHGSRCMRGGAPGSGQTSSRTSVSLHTRISLYARWMAWLGADFVPDISVTKRTDLVVCEVEGLTRGRLRPGHQCH